MNDPKIFVINVGSTSTKLACFAGAKCFCRETVVHPSEDLNKFSSIWEQYEYRKRVVVSFLDKNGIAPESLSAVVSRGGHTRPLSGGAYRINDTMLKESRSGRFGSHACDLGLMLAHYFEKYPVLAMTATTPVTDEFEALAKYSGHPDMPRKSSFHALNHKGVAMHYSKEVHRRYEDINLIVAHMGGGISVAAHKKGKMVDANDALTGDGPFSTNRTGSLPAGKLIETCYSGKYTKEEMLRQVNGEGGLYAYVGETDLQKVEQRAQFGDAICAEVIEAMAYQISKEISACAAVLFGSVDAILLTGGMANSKLLTDYITSRVSFIAPLHIYPGEFEMESLADSALKVLCGQADLRCVEEE